MSFQNSPRDNRSHAMHDFWMTAAEPADHKLSGSVVRSLPTHGRRFEFDSLSGLMASLAMALVLAGCASPGPPRPPSLRLPQPVTDLTVQRIGDQVVLHWTTPAKTTDALGVTSDLAAWLCRNAAPLALPTVAGKGPLVCSQALQLAVKPGPSTAYDDLPSSLTVDPLALLVYRVEIRNSAGRSAGLSNEAFAAAGAAPPAVQDLRATTVSTGAMLEWRISASPIGPAETTKDTVELDRVNLALAATRRSSAKPKSQPLQLAGQEPAEVHLRASVTQQNASSAGSPAAAEGTLDQTARFGQTYAYTAQRVRTVQLKEHVLELRSQSSAVVNLTLRDTFPPAVPSGLVAIPNLQSPTSIDLSWEPNAEPDLAGYLVYRKEVDSATAIRLTPMPLAGPAYRDMSPIAGHRYAYSVAAVDRSGNESKPTAEVQETLPKP